MSVKKRVLISNLTAAKKAIIATSSTVSPVVSNKLSAKRVMASKAAVKVMASKTAPKVVANKLSAKKASKAIK